MSERSRADSERPRAASASGSAAGPSDEDCVLLCRSGGSAELTLLVRRHTPGIYGLMVRLLQDRHLAEDATQEVFLRMHRALDQFDPRRSFRTWLYTIAWNHGRDLLRRRRRQGRVLSLGDRGPSGAEREDGDLEPRDARASTPSELAASQEEHGLVRRALASVDPSHRTLLVLREYEDLSYEEIAEILECRIGTVKSKIHRARVQLREALARLSPELFADRRVGPTPGETGRSS